MTDTNQGVDVDSDTYRQTEIPNRPPEDYTTHERRAEVLNMILEAGHPDLLSRTQLAGRYDVAPSTITRDIQRLRENAIDELAPDIDLISSTVYRKAVREKMDNGEFMEAVELIESFNEWLFDRGAQERAADKQEIDLTADINKEERKVYANVDLTTFPGVDPDNMVGAEIGQFADEDPNTGEQELAVAAEDEVETDGE